MKIEYATLDTCDTATDMVVVIDVLRAFTVSVFAFKAGVETILLTDTVENAHVLRQRFPSHLLVGEVGGLPIVGFDYCNSPSAFIAQDLRGKNLIHRTSAGTQGVVRSYLARFLYAASFTCASATVLAVHRLHPKHLTFVVTGVHDTQGDEDVACADYICALLRNDNPDPKPYLERVKHSPAGKNFTDPARPEYPAADLDCALQVNSFSRALRVQRKSDLFVMQPEIVDRRPL